MIIVGELINATRKAVREAISNRNKEAIQDLAASQARAGATYIDVNAGVFVEDEIDCLQWIIDQVLEATDTPCCIDSPTPRAIEKSLEYLMSRSDQTAMINSISLETERCNNLLPVLAGTDLKVVALCMSDQGMPETCDQRLAIADKLINKLLQNNVGLENIFVDPLVQSLGTSDIYGKEFLNAVDRIMTTFPGVHTICGLSNISYGLPERKRLNQSFMTMAIAKGLDGAIINPLDRQMTAGIITAEALAGRDRFCGKFLGAYRNKMFESNA